MLLGTGIAFIRNCYNTFGSNFGSFGGKENRFIYVNIWLSKLWITAGFSITYISLTKVYDYTLPFMKSLIL